MKEQISNRLSQQASTLGLVVATAAGLAACGGGGGDDNTFSTPLQVPNAATACSSLSGKTVSASLIGEPTTGAVITGATFVPAVADKPNAANTAIVQGTPDYCQVLVSVNPVDPTAPAIKSQVNLPASWNGKKLQFGGSGYNGALVTGVQPSRNAPPDVAMPLTRGYMTAGNDGGHQTPATGSPYAWALNDEAIQNHAYASYKKTNDVAIQIGLMFYGYKPLKSYYMGGSEGGREGMMMAQRYPQDYDGIVAIDPVMNWSGLQTFGNYVGGILQARTGGWLNGKTQLAHDTVKAACDSLDGIADGVVSNYLACKSVAPAALQAKVCASGNDDGPTCFSTAQLATITAAHTGYTFSFPLVNNVTSYAGFNYGGEGLTGNWDRWMAGTVAPSAASVEDLNASRLYQYGNAYVRYFIAKDGNFNPLTYDPANYKARVAQVSGWIDATNPDLSAFFARGGKLILREDLSDTAQSPFTGLNYYDSVKASLGASTVDNSFVAYVASGLPHTSPGIAAGSTNAPAYGIPGSVDLLAPLEAWVENGVKPADQYTLVNKAALPPYAAIASKPLCKYGTYPKFTGTDGSSAASYTCSAS